MLDHSKRMIEGVQKALDTAPTVTVTVDQYGYEIDLGHRVLKCKRTTKLVNDGTPKPALVGWGIKQVAEYAVNNINLLSQHTKKDALKLLKGSPWDHRDSRAIRGTNVHNAIESISKGKEMSEDLTDDERCCVEAVEYLMANRNTKVLASEIVGFNIDLMYAGTFDHWEIDKETGVTWLLDWKTSKGIYPDNALQMAAYQNFTHVLLKTQKVDTALEGKTIIRGKLISWVPEYAHRLAVVHVQPHEATIYPIQASHHDYLFSQFQNACNTKYFLDDTRTYRTKEPKIKLYENTISYGGKINDK